MREFELEKKKLSEILRIIKEVLVIKHKEIDDLYSSYVGNRDDLWKIVSRKNIHIENLESSLGKPYFARIDFIFEDTGEKKIIYIGKNGVVKDNEIYVTDWRAPISSLYYDSDIGECSFKVPGRVEMLDEETTIYGNLLLKRQYDIEAGQLLDYFDIDLVANDSLLQKYLNANNDSRLKSIVSTIQKEQNDVIRKSMSEDLIIQGVAGSGKTTVALHRIAYLVYNYINSVNQNQYVVIGPNNVFLKYIKSVLPELDVSGVSQYTFEEFVCNYIEKNLVISSSFKKANNKIAGKDKSDIDKFKCSLKYKDMIDCFLETFIKNLTEKDLMLGDFKVISSEQIKKVFSEVINGNYGSLDNVLDMTCTKLSKLIKENREIILSRCLDYSAELFQQAQTEEQKDKLRKIFVKDRNEINKGCLATLKKYFKNAKLSPEKMYKLFLSTIEAFDIHDYLDIKALKKNTLDNIRKEIYDFEDLAAILYIKLFISPKREYTKIRHLVIDEAQDFGIFNFLVMKKAFPNASFSIFGDLAQSIYDYRGIDSWEEVNDVIFNNKGQIIEFGKSYRTTAEIMEVADDVAEHIGLSRSDLVVRHGEAVKCVKSEAADIPNYILKKIEEYKEKGYKTIAIISKTELLSNYINDDLRMLHLVIPNIGPEDDLSDEKFNVCTISNQLAKGLEFDAVIINNASENIYSSDNELDMKLLYVAITRALHELDIVYDGNLTKPLAKKKQLGILKR